MGRDKNYQTEQEVHKEVEYIFEGQKNGSEIVTTPTNSCLSKKLVKQIPLRKESTK